MIDLGLASRYGDEKVENDYFNEFCGTWTYMSKEQAVGIPYHGPPQDMWALGVLLWTFVYKKEPFKTEKAIATGYLDLSKEHDAGKRHSSLF